MSKHYNGLGHEARGANGLTSTACAARMLASPRGRADAIAPAALSPESSVPKIQSSKKDMRRSRAAAARNRAQRSALRTAVKRAMTGGTDEQKLAAVKLLDRAARKGLIHRNKAARHKSSLSSK